jgi:hypothetical protein
MVFKHHRKILLGVMLKVLRRIFGLKRDEVTGEWRKFHHEELHDLYSSPSSVGVLKSRRRRWAGHVALRREGRGVYRVSVQNLRERDHCGDPGVDGWMILRRNFRKWNVGVWTVLSWLKIKKGCGHL